MFRTINEKVILVIFLVQSPSYFEIYYDFNNVWHIFCVYFHFIEHGKQIQYVLFSVFK